MLRGWNAEATTPGTSPNGRDGQHGRLHDNDGHREEGGRLPEAPHGHATDTMGRRSDGASHGPLPGSGLPEQFITVGRRSSIVVAPNKLPQYLDTYLDTLIALSLCV